MTDPLDVEAGDRHKLVCPVCRREGRYRGFDTYAEYHEHHHEEHIQE